MNIVAECVRLDIRLTVEGETLKIDAPEGTLTPDLLGELKAHKSEILRELKADRIDVDLALELACNGLPLTPAQFRARLTADDIAAIRAGEIPVQTLKAYAASMAEHK